MGKGLCAAAPAFRPPVMRTWDKNMTATSKASHTHSAIRRLMSGITCLFIHEIPHQYIPTNNTSKLAATTVQTVARPPDNLGTDSLVSIDGQRQ